MVRFALPAVIHPGIRESCCRCAALPAGAAAAASAPRDIAQRSASRAGSVSRSSLKSVSAASILASEESRRFGVSTNATPKASVNGTLVVQRLRIFASRRPPAARGPDRPRPASGLRADRRRSSRRMRTARSIRPWHPWRCSNSPPARCAPNWRSASATPRDLASDKAWQISWQFWPSPPEEVNTLARVAGSSPA